MKTLMKIIKAIFLFYVSIVLVLVFIGAVGLMFY